MTPNEPPAVCLDSAQLRDILPQRHPHLMVDQVLIRNPRQAAGIKNVTMDDPCFQGHFPGNPILPGVLLLEAMIQTGGALLRHSAGGLAGLGWLVALDKAKFRRPVFPGNRVAIEVELLRMRNGYARLRAAATVRSEAVGQAVFTLGLRDGIPGPARSAPDAPGAGWPADAAAGAFLMDIREIMKIIPHRFPFLMIDAILSQSGTHIVALKNISGNEPFFAGHFPARPVMPGTLMLEAMAQAGAVYMLNLPQYRGKIGFFMGIDSARFRRPVRPGDQMVIDMELVTNRPRVGRALGKITVGKALAVEAGFSFVIADTLEAPAASEKKRPA